MNCSRGHITISHALWIIFSPISTHLPKSRLTIPSSRRSIYRQGDIPVNRPRPTRGGAGSAPVDPRSFGPLSFNARVKDEEINAREVAIVDERGNLGPPRDRNEVLRSFDRVKYFLILMNDDNAWAPVCKIVPREKVYEQERASNNTSNKAPKDRKEIEIPWKAAERDVEHKLKIAAEFLEEGRKVDVVLIARRPREIVKDLVQAQGIIDGVRQKIEKINRVTVTVAEQNVMGKSFTLHLEGPVKQKVKKKKDERAAKQIELLWNATDEEIRKKRFRIEELLAVQVPVDLTVTARKKMFEISAEEGEKVLARIWSVMSQIPGIEEVDPREGEPALAIDRIKNFNNLSVGSTGGQSFPRRPKWMLSSLSTSYIEAFDRCISNFLWPRALNRGLGLEQVSCPNELEAHPIPCGNYHHDNFGEALSNVLGLKTISRTIRVVLSDDQIQYTVKRYLNEFS